MNNVHVKRYSQPERVGYQGTIEPEDRAWILFVPVEGLPQLWARGEDGDYHPDCKPQG